MIMKEWVPGAATVNKETWQKSKEEEIRVRTPSSEAQVQPQTSHGNK